MKITQFVRDYNLNLIPVSESSIKLGDMVCKSIFGKIDFEHRNIIFELLEAGIIDTSYKDKLMKAVSDVPLLEAGLADQIIDVEVDHLDDLDIPGLISLKTKISLDKKVKYEFTNVKAKVLRGDLRYEIDSFLDELKDNKWDFYKKNLRKYFMIERLFYANVRISLEKAVAADVEAEFNKLPIPVSTKNEIGKMVTYEFKNDKLPFAMELVKVKKFD